MCGYFCIEFINYILINSIQKYPHIIESYACILNILLFISLRTAWPSSLERMNLLISLGICSTTKLSK